jgi:hypothetical protein
MFLYLASVALVASAIIVLFSVSVTSLLDTNKETVTGARELLPGLGPAVIVEITSTANKSIGTVSFYKGEIIAPARLRQNRRVRPATCRLQHQFLHPLA